MKKWLVILLASGLLAACSGAEEEPKEKEQPKETLELEKDDPKQDELNASLKEEAKPAVFTELNVDNPPKDKKVKIKGEVTLVNDSGTLGTFTVMTDEDGGSGMYLITNMSDKEVMEGKTVTIYGVTTGEVADDGSPIINATIIEESPKASE